MFLSVTCKNKIAKIYKKPSVQSELISQVLFGEKFIIKKKINKFCNINTPKVTSTIDFDFSDEFIAFI